MEEKKSSPSTGDILKQTDKVEETKPLSKGETEKVEEKQQPQTKGDIGKSLDSLKGPRVTVEIHGPRRLHGRCNLGVIYQSYFRLEKEIKVDVKFGNVVYNLNPTRKQLAPHLLARITLVDVEKRKKKIEEEVDKRVKAYVEKEHLTDEDELAFRKWITYEEVVMENETEHVKVEIDVETILKESGQRIWADYDGKDEVVNKYLAWLIITDGVYSPIPEKKVMSVKQLCSLYDACYRVKTINFDGMVLQLVPFFKDGAKDETQEFINLAISSITVANHLIKQHDEANSEVMKKKFIDNFMNSYKERIKTDKDLRLFIMESGDRLVEYKSDDYGLEKVLKRRMDCIKLLMVTSYTEGSKYEKLPELTKLNDLVKLDGWDDKLHTRMLIF
jgi:hypothetical protein